MRTIILSVVLFSAPAFAGSFIYTNSAPWDRLAYLRGVNGGSAIDYTMDATADGLRVTSDAAWISAAAMDSVTQAQIDEVRAQATRPRIEPNGIEIGPDGLLVIQSETNHVGYAYVPLDDGALVAVPVHASPWKTRAEIDAIVASNRASRATHKAAAQAKHNAVTNGLGSVNSVPALRARVQAQAEEIEALKRFIGME
jgi:hypothetical protein